LSATRRIDLTAARATDARALAEAVSAARLVCFPTDTVYGVGGRSTPAVREAVIAAKGRDAGKPLQVVYPSLEVLEASVALEPRVLGAARRLLPGPFTLLVPYPPGLSFPPAGEVPPPASPASPPTSPTSQASPAPPASSISPAASATSSGLTRTLGVRVPAWPPAARGLASLPFGLLASSANPSGGAAPRSVVEVDPGILAACDLLLDAGPVSGLASTVVDLSHYAQGGRWRILRTGAVDEEGVAELLGGAGEEPESP